MEFTVAAFGSSLFVFLLILHESYTFLDPVLLPIVCAPDFVFGFLLCQANFHMDYLLHGIYCSHYFCCFFSSGFHSRIRTSTHILTWGLCALPCDPCIEFICEPIYFVFLVSSFYAIATHMHDCWGFYFGLCVTFIFVFVEQPSRNRSAIRAWMYIVQLCTWRFSLWPQSHILYYRMNFPSSQCCRAHWNYWNFWKLSLRWAASIMLSISEIIAS